MLGTRPAALASPWRREILRTNLWVVPSLEVAGAAVLFGCTLLLDRAEMIQRASERSVPEASDRADVQRRFEAVLTAEAGLARREVV